MSVRLRSVVGVLLIILNCGWPMACGGKTPAASTGTPTPVAVSTETPVPTASPTPLPGMGGCGLPASGPGRCEERHDEDVGVFQTQVDATTAEVLAAHPEYFAADGAITHYGAFRVAMIAGLEARGLCAVVDGEELAVKNDNAFSEQWKVELSNGHLRTGKFAYRAVCRPANFPINPAPLPPRTDCSLPSSFSYACSRLDQSLFLNDLETSMDAVIAEHPELTDGHTVIFENWKPFYDALIAKLRAKGLCAIFDGEEIAVKSDNSQSEQFHPILSSTTLRRGFGNYRGTCEPAAF